MLTIPSLSLVLPHPVHLLENSPSSPVGELAQLESTLRDVLEMLDRVLAYAQEAAAGKPADAALGRYLMDVVGGGVEELGKGGFTSSLQVRSITSGSCIEIISPIMSPRTGYINDVLLGKPCACTGRGFRTAGISDRIIMVVV